MKMKMGLLAMGLAALLSQGAVAQTLAEACLTADGIWIPPVGLTKVDTVTIVGGGGAGGADGSGNFGKGGAAALGGGTGGTGPGAGGGAGLGAGAGAAGQVVISSNVTVGGSVTIDIGGPAQSAGATGEQTCFGATCASGGAGGPALSSDDGLGIGGQAGLEGSAGSGTETRATTVSFGSIYTTQTADQTITLKNKNAYPVTISSRTSDIGSFSVVGGTCSNGSTIAANSTCTVQMRYTPAGASTHTGVITVATTAGSERIPVTGTATVPPTCTNAGVTINNGQSYTFYSQNYLSFGDSCSNYARTASCSNGSWSQSLSGFSNTSCSVAPPASCYSPAHGYSFAHNQTITTYTTNSSSSCGSAVRSSTCNNGIWSTAPASYTSCSVPAATCTAGTYTQYNYWWGPEVWVNSSGYNSNASSCAQACAGPWVWQGSNFTHGTLPISATTVVTHSSLVVGQSYSAKAFMHSFHNECRCYGISNGTVMTGDFVNFGAGYTWGACQ